MAGSSQTQKPNNEQDKKDDTGLRTSVQLKRDDTGLMADNGIRVLERNLSADESNLGVRMALAAALERGGRYSEERQHAVYVLQRDNGDYGRQALSIILPSIREFSNSTEPCQIGSEIGEKNLYFHKLTAKPENITLGDLRAHYELGLADQIIQNPVSSQEHLRAARDVWKISHIQKQGNITADIVRYGLTIKDVEKLAGKKDIEVEQGLTENDTIVEWVVRPKGFKQTKSGEWKTDYGDGKIHIVKLPEAEGENLSGWAVWPEDRPPYTHLGIPSGKLTRNRNEAVQSMVNAGIPLEIAQTEASYFWRRKKGYRDVVAVGRWFDVAGVGPLYVDVGVGPGGRGGDVGWLRASRLKGTK